MKSPKWSKSRAVLSAQWQAQPVSWGPSAPGTVHHAAKQLWCLITPWKSEAANAQRALFVLLWNPWRTMPLEYLSLEFIRRSKQLRKRADQIPTPCSVSVFLSSLWHNSPSVTIRHHHLPPHARSDIWCVCDCSTAQSWDVQGIQAPSCYELIAHLL